MSNSNDPKKKNPFLYKIGMGILALSCAIWLIPFIVPFTPFSISVKSILIVSFLVLAEVMFWIGVAFVGKEVAMKMRDYLSFGKWRKTPKKQEDVNDSKDEE